MKKLLLLVLFLIPFINHAQHDEAYVDEQVATFAQELQNNGVNKYFVYKSYCVGETQMITIRGKLCISKGTFFQSYVVWNEGGIDKIKKFDNCGSFYTNTMTSARIRIKNPAIILRELAYLSSSRRPSIRKDTLANNIPASATQTSFSAPGQ